MALQSGAGRVRSGRAAPLEAPEYRLREDEGPPARDLKKIVLIAGLGILSWVATYVGMLELIEANMGELPLIHKVIIAFSVAMLMTMIIWLLDQLFAPIPTFTKVLYAAGYVFLTIISVGFGFGFYWKVLESRSEASRSAESAVAQVQGSLNAAATRLDQLESTLVKLAGVSAEKAEIERTKGTSCPNSRPGDGPRRKMRDEDATRFSFASDLVKERATAVKGQMSGLDVDLAKIVSNDPSTLDPKSGTRNEFMKALSRKLDMTVTGFNAFRTDPQLRQLRNELSDRAEQSTFGDPKKGGFLCPDAQLQGALRGAVKAIDQLPELEKPKIAAVEGSEATIEAFRRLTATFYGALSFGMPPSAEELRALQQRAVQTVEGGARDSLDIESVGLSKRDYVPLAVAVFVDLCLLLVSMGRPVNRLGGLLPRMREAERSPVSTILSRFSDIHRDPDIRQTFEVFRHVVFDQAGVYYVAVPLDAAVGFGDATGHRLPRPSVRPAAALTPEAQDLQHEAHLLANLFTSFEKDRIFARVHSPLLTTRAVQKKLARQGSKFAGCRAFRIYRFRDGAWQEMILGAVMGAARRAEDHRAATARDVTRDVVREGAGAVAWTSPAAPRPRLEPELGGLEARPATAARETPGTEADRRFAAEHGPYARAAREELTPRPTPFESELEVRAANSNTAPVSRPADPAPAEERGGPSPAPDLAPDLKDAAPTVVPLRPRPLASVSSPAPAPVPEGAAGIDLGAAACARAIEPAERIGPPADSDVVVDVVMRRETATFRIPVSQATLPSELMQFGGQPAGAAAAAAAHAHPLPPIAAIARAIAPPTDDRQEAWPDNALEAFDDADIDGAASLAGRLRPALPAV